MSDERGNVAHGPNPWKKSGAVVSIKPEASRWNLP
jgi:hypothetical protein